MHGRIRAVNLASDPGFFSCSIKGDKSLGRSGYEATQKQYCRRFVEGSKRHVGV